MSTYDSPMSYSWMSQKVAESTDEPWLSVDWKHAIKNCKKAER